MYHFVKVFLRGPSQVYLKCKMWNIFSTFHMINYWFIAMYWIFSFWKIFRFLFNCKTLMTLIDTLVFGAGVLSDSMSDTIVRFLQWCPSHIRGLMFPRCFLAWCHSLVFAVMSQSHGNILPGCCSLMPDSCSAITFWRPFSAEKSLPEDHFCIEDGVWNVVLWVMDSVVRLLQWCHSMMACL